MASKARQKFDQNLADIARLMEIHGDLGGRGPGRRHRLEVLNKSAVVLICAFWEAYCEDLVTEALQRLVKYSPNSDALSLDLRKMIAKDLKKQEHELAIWQLAGTGWRTYLLDRHKELEAKRNRLLNTPKTSQVNALFSENLGIDTVSKSWTWNRNTQERTSKALDRFVELRGSIAHRGSAGTTVRKDDVDRFFGLVKRLVSKTGGQVSSMVKRATGTSLFERPKTKPLMPRK